MADILVVRCRVPIAHELLEGLLDNLKAQKETGVILLPPYLEAQVVPDDIGIKLTGPDDSDIMFVDADKII